MSTEKVKESMENKKGNTKEAKSSRKKPAKDSKQLKDLKDQIAVMEKQVALAQEETDKVKDQLLRKMAEFDNYRRRTEKEFIENIQSASKELIEDLLPVVDDFRRTISHAEIENNNSPLLDGIRLVYKNFMNTLTKRGLSEIEAVGQEFNPEEHDALMQVESDKYESGFVVEEHSRGYKLNDKVIRHSQVLVAK